MAIIVVVLIIFEYAPSIHQLSSFILPGFEGPNAGVAGIALNSNQPGSVNFINASLPSPWSWKSTDPHQAVVYNAGGWTSYLTLEGSCEVEIDVQNPQPANPPAYTVPQSFTYWVNTTNADGSTTYEYVTAQVQFYTFYIDVKVINTASLNACVFSSQEIWLQLQSSTWDNALQVQNEVSGSTSVPVYGYAWSAPIFASVSQYSQSSNLGNCLGNFHDISPDHQGADFTLYSSPGASTISDLGYNEQKVVGQTLQQTNPIAPSTAMSENAYFPVGLVNYGVTQPPNTCSLFTGVSPVTDMVASLVMVQLGTYTFTEPQGVQPSHQNPSGSGNNGDLFGIGAWLSNPFNLAGLLGVLGITVIAVLAIMFLPEIIELFIITRGQRRN